VVPGPESAASMKQEKHTLRRRKMEPAFPKQVGQKIEEKRKDLVLASSEKDRAPGVREKGGAIDVELRGQNFGRGATEFQKGCAEGGKGK